MIVFRQKNGRFGRKGGVLEQAARRHDLPVSCAALAHVLKYKKIQVFYKKLAPTKYLLKM